MAWLKEHFPILFSPKFWGAFFTATIILLLKEGWVDQYVGEWLATVAGLATGIGVADSVARKIGNK